jgi:nicotinamidase-related amidase
MSTLELNLRHQVLAQDYFGHTVWQTELEKKSIASENVAIVVCDMWDNHWSRGAAERVEDMVPRMNDVLYVLREWGAHIIHAPSDTMAFYAGTAPRMRMAAVPTVEPPPSSEHVDPPLPIDDSDEGSDTGETETFAAWHRQHPGITIVQDRDWISDSGQEIYSFIRREEIEQLLIMGVHTNMCVLNRSFGIKQMVRWGVNIALFGDLTDAMYNPARLPYVSHQEGTRLVVEYIEKFWCPTVHSGDLLAI